MIGYRQPTNVNYVSVSENDLALLMGTHDHFPWDLVGFPNSFRGNS